MDTLKPFDKDGKRNIVSVEEAMKELEAYEPPKRALVPKPAEGVEYCGLIWEARAPTDNNRFKPKALLEFNISQKRLEREGYERHPLIQEYFALMRAYLDPKECEMLSEEQTGLAADVLQGSHPEYTSQIMETAQDKDKKTVKFTEGLTAKHPSNFHIGGIGQKTIFDISDLQLDSKYHFKDIYEKHGDLVRYLCSRDFNDLPDAIKDEGSIRLPTPVQKVIVGFNSTLIVQNASIAVNSIYSASRGVRKIK